MQATTATDLLNDNAVVDATEPDEIVAKVRILVEQDEILEARRLLAAARQRGVSSRQLERWQQVLKLPKAKPAGQATGRRLSKTSVWLKQHGAEYRGRWIALVDGQLIGADTSRAQLQQSLQQTGKLQGTTFIRL